MKRFLIKQEWKEGKCGGIVWTVFIAIKMRDVPEKWVLYMLWAMAKPSQWINNILSWRVNSIISHCHKVTWKDTAAVAAADIKRKKIGSTTNKEIQNQHFFLGLKRNCFVCFEYIIMTVETFQIQIKNIISSTINWNRGTMQNMWNSIALSISI